MTFLLVAHYDKPARIHAYILLNLAASEAIERQELFVYAPEEKGLDVDSAPGPIVTRAESKEDPECLKRKFQDIFSPQINICHRSKDQSKELQLWNTAR